MNRFTNLGLSRRQVLRLGGFSAAAFAGASNLPAMHVLSSGAGGGDYKALVCIFLYGGADSFNLIVPTSGAEYATYAAARGDLAEAQGSLLPINPITSDGATYGLHSATPELQGLFQSGKLAFIANVGSLIQPLTKAQFQTGAFPTPRHLFSHNNQQEQWQKAHANSPASDGWAGRMLDQMPNVNGGSPLSPGIGIEVAAQLLVGAQSAPYVLGLDGTESVAVAEEPARRAVFEKLMRSKNALGSEFGKRQLDSIAIDDYLSSTLGAGPDYADQFGPTFLAQQLRVVARMIAIRQQLGVSRQVFFVGVGDYDTHDDQVTRLPPLFAELSSSLAQFQAVMDSINEGQNVTAFTHSEFGRTLSSNGQGSDHGWGGHSLAVGGAVLGQEIYGTMPDLAVNGADDIGEGRILPTTGIDQYASTLAKWFGLTPAQVAAVFPNVSSFATSDLGFLV